MIYLVVLIAAGAALLLFIITELERKRTNKQRELWRGELNRLIASEREEDESKQAEVEELERMMNVERRSR